MHDLARLFGELRSACAAQDAIGTDHWLRAILLSQDLETARGALHYALAHFPSSHATAQIWRWAWWLGFIEAGQHPTSDPAARLGDHFLIAPLSSPSPAG